VTTIGVALAGAVRLGGDGRGRFHASSELSSWPGIVHGGGLVAALDEAAARLGGPTGARRIEGRLTSSVPVETPLDLEGYVEGGTVSVSLLDTGQPLTTGSVRAIETPLSETAPPWRGGVDGLPLPTSEQCLACGSANPLGLRLSLSFDTEGVWARFVPSAAWHTPETLHPALAPVVLDEIAWWLGALATREGGLTNRIDVTLTGARAPVTQIAAFGRFDEVTSVDRRGSFRRTAVTLAAADVTLARASIVFRGGPEYSARQIEYFRGRAAPGVFSRMFPNYAA
jgi:hypothetical protein